MTDPISEICQAVSAQLDDPGIIYALRAKPEQFEALPIGIPQIDDALCGGIPTGRITEIYGMESSGKTTLMLHLVSECQKRGAMVYFVDAENALDLNYARRIGVKPERMIFSQPDYGEQALEVTRHICEAVADYNKKHSVRLPSVVIVDSVAALVPKQEFDSVEEKGLDAASAFAGRATMLSRQLPRLLKSVSKSGVALVFINQERDNPGVMYGPKTTQPGGRALKFFASVRIRVHRAGNYPKTGDAIGIVSRITPVKSKLYPIWGKTAEVVITQNGIDQVIGLMETCIEAGIITKGGAWMHYGDVKFQGALNFEDALRKDKSLFDKLSESYKQHRTPKQ